MSVHMIFLAFIMFVGFGTIYEKLEINRLHMRVMLDELRDFRGQAEPKQNIEAQEVQATETTEAQPQDIQTVETTILAEPTLLPELTGTFCNKVTIYCERS